MTVLVTRRKPVFRRFDRNKNGELSRDDFRRTLLDFFGMNLTEVQCRQVFDKIDTNGNGLLSRDELIQGFMGWKPTQRRVPECEEDCHCPEEPRALPKTPPRARAPMLNVGKKHNQKNFLVES